MDCYDHACMNKVINIPFDMRERERESMHGIKMRRGLENQVGNGRKTCEKMLVKMKNIVRWVLLASGILLRGTCLCPLCKTQLLQNPMETLTQFHSKLSVSKFHNITKSKFLCCQKYSTHLHKINCIVPTLFLFIMYFSFIKLPTGIV